jgi:hypothetical protein
MRTTVVEDAAPVDDDAMLAMLRRQRGIVTWRQARRYRSPAALRHQVKSGRWRRVHRGVLAAQPGPLGIEQRHWVGLLAAGADRHPGQVGLGGWSALWAWGLDGLEPTTVHLLIPHRSRVSLPPGCVAHRTLEFPDLVQTHPALLPTSPPERAVLDAAAWARSDDEARLIVAASFQQRLVTLAELHRTAASLPNRRRRRLVLSVAADCAGGAHSLGELDLLAVCRRARLPVPARQVAVRDRRGRRRYLDAVFEPWGVVVEVDGIHHLDVARQWDDARRSNALELDGYLVLRYPAHVVRARPAEVAAELREALIRRGWRPPIP